MNKNKLALTPPMGWNSWDCYGAAVNEEQLLGNAEYIAKNLKQHGFKYVVCDIQWYEPNAKSNDYNNFTELQMDEFSRLIPADNRFPSSANGVGFKAIADKIHAMGLKFGIHIMRGIPRQAVHQNTRILGTAVTARQIAHHFSVCSWNTDMYGVDCTKNGAQEYYDSIFKLYAEWGVDFVKVDDICNTEFKPSEPYSAKLEIETIRKAIDNCGRDMVLSLSPGPAQTQVAEHLCENANMWRMTGDFWDEWDKLYNMFDRCEMWYSVVKEGCWPDCDMLPLGRLSKNAPCHGDKNRYTNFTENEQITMLTLWCIFRSPLFLGGELRENREWDLKLITNDEVLEVNQQGFNAKPVRNNSESVVWKSSGKNGEIYLAMFNVNNKKAIISVNLSELDIQNEVKIRDLWANKDLDNQTEKITAEIEPHGAILYKLG